MIVDAGVGTASDAAIAMELGADGVLMNTAIAEAQDAVLMAEAMRDAVIAGRKSCLAGRMPKRSEEHTSELQSRLHLVCRLLLEKKKKHATHLHIHPVGGPIRLPTVW